MVLHAVPEKTTEKMPPTAAGITTPQQALAIRCLSKLSTSAPCTNCCEAGCLCMTSSLLVIVTWIMDMLCILVQAMG